MTESLCDTLCCLPTDSTPLLETLPSYKDMGFFQGDSLLHPEVEIKQMGFSGIPRSYQLWRDDWVTLFVLICFLLLVVVLKKTRFNITAQTKDFFFPSKNAQKEEKAENNNSLQTSLFMMFILSIMGGLGMFVFTQNHLDLFLGQISPYMLIALYIGIWVIYFLTKVILSSFVNWIFFDKTKRKLWQKAVFYLTTAESLLFIPVIIVTVYFNLPANISLWIIVAIGLLIKILLLYKTFLIFFSKFYGTLHLIVYFCTLEIMPLLVVFKILIRVTDELIVKF